MKKFEFLKKNLEEAIRKHIERHNRETEKAFLITAETVQKKKDEKKIESILTKKRRIVKALTSTQSFII